MKRLKPKNFWQLFSLVTILGVILLFVITRPRIQAGDEPVLTPSYLAVVLKAITPTPTPTHTPTSTPTPTLTPTPTVTATPVTPGDSSVLKGVPTMNVSDHPYIYLGYHKAGCFNISSNLQTSRGLLKFNVPYASPGMTITEATLNVRLFGICWSEDGPREVQAYRINEDWTPETVHWNNQPSRASTSAGSVTMQLNSNIPFDWYEIDITDLVQDWAGGTVPNYGLMLRSPEGSGSSSAWIVFYSEESNNSDPFLDITYSNGATAVVPLTGLAPAQESLPTTTCGTTPEGMSFCNQGGVMPFSTE